jgi:hypothetical protein
VNLRIKPSAWPRIQGNHACDPNRWIAVSCGSLRAAISSRVRRSWRTTRRTRWPPIGFIDVLTELLALYEAYLEVGATVAEPRS